MPKRAAVAALVLALLAVLVAETAGAQGGTAVECRREGVTRRIEVLRDPARGRACEVRYVEPGSETVPAVAWFSARNRDSCHGRADMLIATLARTGWVCDVMRKRNVVAESDSPGGAGPDTESGPRIVVPRPQ
jgi:hypothetical protein